MKIKKIHSTALTKLFLAVSQKLICMAKLFYAYTESGSTLKDIIQRKIIFNQISEDLSKPLRRFDSELEYVPTQMICEYCKLNGADGIRFNSSLHKGGKNIVLFNYGNAVCVEVTDKEVNNVIIESK